MKNLKYFSFSEDEWFLDEDYILDQIEEDNRTDAEFKTHKDYLNVSYLIESMCDSAYEDFEDCGDYLTGFYENKNKSEKYFELQNLLLDWFNKNITQPNWYEPKNVKKISIKEFKEMYC